ncbi:deoxyribonuclease V [Pyrinomonas methylaliphatogenes]|jgi:deoxyribonuclease V|uniref:Endonuclease V n=1 Tax=Pyrinomonas methylaliphatogenes TaxID=454194 RepID=A0A0B6X2B0_9BACT|nr:deoxyribonuclease V [Pyrinomonas methylaliphatogenes]MBX5477719.1 deoxyribonuclease V [Pyrinomonas methylaliphatogenes]CDM67092.1 Endonuclease V [Pyrinomonas methylaliphatogenes]
MAHFQNLHSWALSPREAVELQRSLRGKVRIEPLGREIGTIAGADISFDKFSSTVYAGIVVLRLPSLEVIEEVGVRSEAQFPYVPGLLSFRETPPLLEAWAKLKCEPDAVMLDGQGIAHPRRVGIASHFGLIVDRPALGCAKSVLVGRYVEPEREPGSWTPLVHQGETVGAALRTKAGVQPVFVSPGHLIDLQGAIALTLRCCKASRVPEPTRLAHLLVNAVRRGERTIDELDRTPRQDSLFD